ncbi:hypothetical protein VTJ49DRAFT_1844 [Mycothermus thermophilus]|uniref:L-dopachrome isomerase n=1 Tax=Humicola insolens TaxID=85995 RepID=A0ABR3VBL4_HUMIN
MSWTTQAGARAARSDTPASMSPLSERDTAHETSHPTVARLVEGNHILRHIDRAPPGDIVRKSSKSSRSDLTKQRSRKFFDDAFSTGSGGSLARDTVCAEAIVMAELTTNVIVNDEYTLVTELARLLSSRYQRPVSCIAVTVRHGACVFIGGTFDPAYIMTVSALPPLVQPATNKRNAALIQKHMELAIRVPASRGIVRFVPVQEDHIAWGGKTAAGRIDELERGLQQQQQQEQQQQQQHRRDDDFRRGLASPLNSAGRGDGGGGNGKAPVKKKLSVKSFGSMRQLKTGGGTYTPSVSTTTAGSVEKTFFDTASRPTTPSSAEQQIPPSLAARPRSAQKKRSFVSSIFGRKSGEGRGSLPATLEE